ncbi:MAG: serine protease [Patescibacteria group bacterium]
MKYFLPLFLLIFIAAGCNNNKTLNIEAPKTSLQQLNSTTVLDDEIRSNEMEHTIKNYYDLLNSSKYEEAFQAFSDKFKETKDFSKWKQGYKDTYNHSVGAMFCENNECTFTVTATEDRATDFRKTDYTFYYTFVREGGAVKIDTAKFISQSLAKIITKKEEVQNMSDDKIILSSVKIYCLNSDNSEISQGSGTLLKNNLVISNFHIKGYDFDRCGVAFSNNEGRVNYDKMYIVTRNISQDYNTDYWVFEIEGNHQSNSLTLPFCKDNQVTIGDKIKIYGYPAIGGGNVTITDGLLSSHVGDTNNYMTSAKIDHGNSGGTAIDISKNCFLGIPTAGKAGGLESMGYILNVNNVPLLWVKTSNQRSSLL